MFHKLRQVTHRALMMCQQTDVGNAAFIRQRFDERHKFLCQFIYFSPSIRWLSNLIVNDSVLSEKSKLIEFFQTIDLHDL